MFTNFASLAFAIVGLNPMAVLNISVGHQDGRMDRFVAMPTDPEPQPSITEPAPHTITFVVRDPSVVKLVAKGERTITLDFDGTEIFEVINELKKQKVSLLIDVGRIPTDCRVTASLQAVAESTAMTALGEALGGAFNNRNGVWVFSKTSQLPFSMPMPMEPPMSGQAFDSAPYELPARAINETVKATNVEVMAYSTAVRRGINLSPAQVKLNKQRGYLHLSELSKYQRQIVGPVKPGATKIIGSLKVKG